MVLALALLVTMAPACGKEKGEVKTLKIGVLLPLSGPGAPWGVADEIGVRWATSKVNAAGGIKVGADRYMIELVNCDTKMIGSNAADCATMLAYDEGVRFAIGTIVTEQAVMPIFHETKVISVAQDAGAYVSSDYPYKVNGGPIYKFFLEGFYEMFARDHPEVKTVYALPPDNEKGHYYAELIEEILPKNGITVIGTTFLPQGAVDFYPILTKVLAENPDGIIEGGAGPGDMALVLKQARELGYEGMFLYHGGCPVKDLIEIAGADKVWGIVTSEADFSSPMMPQHAQDLYQEWYQNWREPGEISPGDCCRNGYTAVMFIKAAIERAGSINPDDVLIVLDEDPNLTWETFYGEEAGRLGGLEYHGIKRDFTNTVFYGEIVDAEHVYLAKDIIFKDVP